VQKGTFRWLPGAEMSVRRGEGADTREHRAEYLIGLAHMSIGYDIQGMAFRMLISLAFLSGITVCQGNRILDNLDLPKL